MLPYTCMFVDQDRGVDCTIFQEPCKTHLTIGCLVLLDDSDIRRAVEVLQDSGSDIVRYVTGYMAATLSGMLQDSGRNIVRYVTTLWQGHRQVCYNTLAATLSGMLQHSGSDIVRYGTRLAATLSGMLQHSGRDIVRYVTTLAPTLSSMLQHWHRH